MSCLQSRSKRFTSWLLMATLNELVITESETFFQRIFDGAKRDKNDEEKRVKKII